MFKTSQPCIFADINKKTRDLLVDDYFNGSKFTMKIKKVQPMNITLEAKTVEGKPIVSKISADVKPCDYCKIKKVSIDSTGMMVGDVDIEKVFKNTTFMIRSLKNFNEDGMKKAEIGLKVLTKDVTLNCGFDCITQKYSADAVYGYNQILAGVRVFGKGMETPSCDASIAYAYNKQMIVGCTAYNLMETLGLSLYYKLRKDLKFGATCMVKPGSGEVPEYTFGLKYKPSKKTTIRAKITEKGLFSSCVKTEIDKKITFSGGITADLHDIASSNRAAIGVELVF